MDKNVESRREHLRRTAIGVAALAEEQLKAKMAA